MKIHPRLRTGDAKFAICRGFIIDPTAYAGKRQLKPAEVVSQRARQPGQPGRTEPRSSAASRRFRATWKSARRRRQRTRKMRGDLQVLSEAVASGARSGETRRSDRRHNRKVVRRRKPCRIISRSRKIHTVAQAAGGSSAIPKAPSRGQLRHGASAPPKGCRAGKPAHGIAGKAGPVRQAGQPARPHRRPAGHAAGDGATRSRSAACGAGDTWLRGDSEARPTGAARAAELSGAIREEPSAGAEGCSARGNPQQQRCPHRRDARPSRSNPEEAASGGLNGSMR